jgi:hypothetical protein
MRGGKRENAGRPKLNHIRKTFYLTEENMEYIKSLEGKTLSEKINKIIENDRWIRHIFDDIS